MSEARAARIADRIREIIATTLDRGVKDPRLGFVTVTDVRVTNDLQHATVFYTVFGDEAARSDSAAALESAKGMLRTEVGRRIQVRLTPSLEFVPDAIPENAARIQSLLDEAARRDEELHRRAEGAEFAGDADPYRVPGSLDDVADADSEDPAER